MQIKIDATFMYIDDKNKYNVTPNEICFVRCSKILNTVIIYYTVLELLSINHRYVSVYKYR